VLRQHLRDRRDRTILDARDAGPTGRSDLNGAVREARPHGLARCQSAALKSITRAHERPPISYEYRVMKRSLEPASPRMTTTELVDLSSLHTCGRASDNAKGRRSVSDWYRSSPWTGLWRLVFERGFGVWCSLRQQHFRLSISTRSEPEKRLPDGKPAKHARPRESAPSSQTHPCSAAPVGEGPTAGTEPGYINHAD